MWYTSRYALFPASPDSRAEALSQDSGAHYTQCGVALEYFYGNWNMTSLFGEDKISCRNSPLDVNVLHKENLYTSAYWYNSDVMAGAAL